MPSVIVHAYYPFSLVSDTNSSVTHVRHGFLDATYDLHTNLIRQRLNVRQQ